MKTGTLLAIVLFTLVAIAHAARLALGLPVTVGNWPVPPWISAIGVIVPAAVAWLLYRESQ